MKQPIVFLAIGILCIGLYPILVKTVHVPGVPAAFYRMFLATLAFIPFFIGQNIPLIVPKKWIFMTVLAGFLFAADIAVWNVSIQISSPTLATLLTNLSPIWVGMISFLFLPNKPTFRFWIGALIAFIGMLILLGWNVILEINTDLGFYLAVLSGIFYANYMLVSKQILRHTTVFIFFLNMMAVASFFLLIFTLYLGQPLSGYDFPSWISLATQAIVCQLIGWLAISFAVQKMEAGTVSLTLLTQAVITGILSWIIIGERFESNEYIGGSILLLGIAFTYWKKKKVTE